MFKTGRKRVEDEPRSGKALLQLIIIIGSQLENYFQAILKDLLGLWEVAYC